MIKLLIFDMDGTLIDLKEVHYEALNRALSEVDSKYVITREEHENRYDGLPTKMKLEMLTQEKGLPISDYKIVWDRKQELTLDVINDTLEPNMLVCETLRKLKSDGYLICVASNSIRQTIEAALRKTRLHEFVDQIFSNEDVINPKPHPEMFAKAIAHFKLKYLETLIVEDSEYGITAVEGLNSHKAYRVNSPNDIIYDNINKEIFKISNLGGRDLKDMARMGNLSKNSLTLKT